MEFQLQPAAAFPAGDPVLFFDYTVNATTHVNTLPNFKTCGLATTALNLVLPGPGNTFTAAATPRT